MRGQLTGHALPGATAVRCVRVLEADPTLLRAVPPAAATRLRHQLVAEALDIPARGAFPVTAMTHGVLGLLILEGLVLRAVTVARRRTVELLGPGDVVRPWQDEGQFAVLPSSTVWTALEPARVAVLDADFAAVANRFSGVADELLRRAIERCHALSERLAIASIPSLPERLLMILWHLADRWGVVEPEGVRIPLRLSHQLLAELACAQRPSVSVAVKQLVAEGLAMRGTDGGWMLVGPMPVADADACAPPVTAVAIV